MKENVWKKAYLISFAVHLVIIITIGALTSGFHEQITPPKEKLITVNLEDFSNTESNDTHELTASIADSNSNNDNDNHTINNKDLPMKDKSQNQQNTESVANTTLSDKDGVLPYVAGTGNTNKESSYQGSGGSGSSSANGSGGSGASGNGGSNGTRNSGTGAGGGNASTEDKYSVAARFARAVEAHKVYPYAAVRLNQQGTVTVSVTIDASGNLVAANVISSVNGNLDKAALNAVYSACPFQHGLGESITMQVPVKFYLN